MQWIGVPCGINIGIGSTKTLAKLANHVAKTAKRKPGTSPSHLAQVCDLAALVRSDLKAILSATALGDIWGVGRRIAAQLAEGGVNIALVISRLDPATVRAQCESCLSGLSESFKSFRVAVLMICPQQ